MYAIYSRQSLDKKDSISIETQIQHCVSMIGGKEYRTYIDKGFSGKNTARPQYQKMMEDVRAGRVHCVVVYRLDRLSRSLLDFAKMMDDFAERGVSFLSTQENFDTSTPIGKAMLSIIMVFAQLERETIQLRVTDAFYARHERGAYDGKAPFGYQKCKVMHDGKRACSIEINPETAPLLRSLFDTYVSSSISLGGLAKELNRAGIPSPGGHEWDSCKLSRIMSNPIYVRANISVYEYYTAFGVDLTNPVDDFTGDNGIVTYGKWDHNKRKFEQMDKIKFSLGLHKGLIDPATFLRCQRKLSANKQVANGAKGKYTWLTGVIKCGYCGHALCVKKTATSKPYFSCSGKTNYGVCTEFEGKYYVADVEHAVETELFKMIEKKRDLSSKIEAEENAEERHVKTEIIKIDEQTKRLIDAIADGVDDDIKPILDRIKELNAMKRELSKQLGDIQSKHADNKTYNLGMVIDQWDKISVEQKREFVRKLIDKILLAKDGIQILWKYNFS